MTNSPTVDSPMRMARAAGVLYLVIFIVYPLASGLGRARILVPGDAAATAENLLASQSMFRLGLAGEALVFLVEIVLAGLLYVLLRPVNQPLSLASALSRLAEAVVQGVNLLTSSLVLLLVSGAGYLAAFEPEQLNALVLLFLQAGEDLILTWGFFFGFHLLLLGYLVFKSGYFPRLLGVLLALAGIGYLVESFGAFLAPQSGELLATIVLILAIPGELIFAVWLLWKGIEVRRWEEEAQGAANLGAE